MKTSLGPFLLFSGLNFLNCSQATDNDMRVWAAPAISQRVSQKSSTIISFVVTAIGSPCGSYSHLENQQSGFEHFIKIFVKEPKNVICPAVVIAFDVKVEVPISQQGSYSFHFWQSDSKNVDTTIVIP